MVPMRISLALSFIIYLHLPTSEEKPPTTSGVNNVISRPLSAATMLSSKPVSKIPRPTKTFKREKPLLTGSLYSVPVMKGPRSTVEEPRISPNCTVLAHRYNARSRFPAREEQVRKFHSPRSDWNPVPTVTSSKASQNVMPQASRSPSVTTISRVIKFGPKVPPKPIFHSQYRDFCVSHLDAGATSTLLI
jgi:hypothetical protein